MKKLYIAGKITGNPDFKQQFEEAERKLLAKGYAVLNPANNPDNLEYEDYMHIGFAMIDVADGVYFLPNWEDSPGAYREYYAAKAKGKRIFNNINEFDYWGW